MGSSMDGEQEREREHQDRRGSAIMPTSTEGNPKEGIS